ncbi:30S ribosomal protein S12 methylthiotransferase RimO [Anaerotignum lactatifermentans]|uniref:Ribosomal protein uS12 methylthiotransferase RimO n=1 Tax=Anaerotignum lactatifermentans TaxID=160404 RepID=A0ABS2G9P5_9FIRM|nr:30S ribosomal protein S12 methylthiotransferase RimO [Anaerotignum lactatifermentans]MBM6829849.1 30S ribosomal protein S12 methylthiotransferase RimO [Anaerotignum lactatifermentans]MBM6878211.1 30S ribosomal protein S12 methylthiotransferase RimO [Anaerotignum lactatifermentans]MBM6951291.1 30S ribosomal protein S12 methylthiotransferase RimO [Anaerotignum lactatifermentans]
MKATVAFTSLGCDKNRVDSEVMLGILRDRGYEAVADEAQADLIVVNTCCFIRDALEESIETILEMAKYKEEGNCKGLIVTGCLGQRYEAEFFQELPEVDAVLGTAAYEEIADAADRILEGEKGFKLLEDIDKPMRDENGKGRILSTAPYFAYLKISEGCDNHCTYCVIPKMRGRHRSRTMESLVEETQALARQGVKELVIVAQDTSIYGRDLYGEPKLHELLEKLAAVEGIQWIRLLYCYPETLTQETIDVMAKNEKICHYIDMPIQHGCDSVLKRMGRKSSQELIRQTVKKLRAAMPDIAIRTTLIVGFPGETEEEFAQLQEFVKEMRFDRLGVFCYSQEEGTPAAKMEGQIDEEVKEERQKIIMDIQKQIAASLCEKEVGKVVEVLAEGKLPEENVYCGRTRRDAPDIDGMVFFKAEEEVYSGDFVSVEIKEAGDYDLMGDVVYADEFTQ